ncbi:hypothetical protein L596_011075 [Steinernema carpocapsae]|uniref:Tropomodulin n=1 Tax=Steinernema carpocapsae TaxID=34508 RepID=A0A4U5NTN3_STECR|nr:hypothetical protein L596_011075 [Steinernema carpocapsae]
MHQLDSFIDGDLGRSIQNIAAFLPRSSQSLLRLGRPFRLFLLRSDRSPPPITPISVTNSSEVPYFEGFLENALEKTCHRGFCLPEFARAVIAERLRFQAAGKREFGKVNQLASSGFRSASSRLEAMFSDRGDRRNRNKTSSFDLFRFLRVFTAERRSLPASCCVLRRSLIACWLHITAYASAGGFRKKEEHADMSDDEEVMTDADFERALDALKEQEQEGEVGELLKMMNENRMISWEEAEQILGDTGTAPVKSSLPEQTRPTEPDNDTDVDESIRRLQNNDPELTQINLNNMKRTPIPQIQRLIAAIQENTHLEKLSLANMGLYDGNVEPLIDVIENNVTLRSINLETNYLSAQFFSRLFQAALKNQSLEEVKAVNQGVSFATNLEKEIIDAIFENRGLTKVSINIRLPEGRHKIENATLRNGEIKRVLRRQAAEEERKEAQAKALKAAKAAEAEAKRIAKEKKDSEEFRKNEEKLKKSKEAAAARAADQAAKKAATTTAPKPSVAAAKIAALKAAAGGAAAKQKTTPAKKEEEPSKVYPRKKI